MTAVNKGKSAARLASLKKCAAALTLPAVKGQPISGGRSGVFNPFSGTKQVAGPQKPAAPQYYKPGVPMHQSTGNYVSKQDFLRMSRIATPWTAGRFIRQEDAADLVARGRLSKDNVARATGTMTPEQYMMQRHGWDADKASTYRMPVSGGLPVHDYETQGGAMKTSFDRSAARLASLQKVAAADRSAARLETLRKCAERRFVKVSETRSALRRKALGLV